MPINPQLERQYNARAAVPSHPEIFESWRSRSAAFRETADAVLDLAYGPSPAETLDLFLSGVSGAPLHMFIHGGAWQSMDKSDFSFLAEALAAAGIDVAVVNYGLCPEVSVDDIVTQMQRAVSWLWEHAREYGADPERFQVSGHSAGGHLTAMLMATDWPRRLSGAPRRLISSGIAISGVFDLEPLCQTSLNGKLGLDKEAARANSPIFQRPSAPGVPLILAVGALESDGFHWQSDSMRASWRAKGVPVERTKLWDRHHFSSVEALADPDSWLFRTVVELIR